MTGFSQRERRGLERMQRLQTGQAHPDADLLTAFSEQTLTGREREQMLTHLAICTTCREVLVLASPAVQKALAPNAAGGPMLWKWSILRWGAVAASAVIVVIAVFIGHYEKRATSVAPFTSRAARIAVPATTEQKVLRDETLLAPAASPGMKAPQIRYEKVVPPARKDVATEQLNAGLRAKKRLDASSSHAVVGAMLASKPGEVGPAAADTLTAGVVTESTADGLKASMDDNELRRATPAPARVPGMEIRAASAPSSSETVQVTRDAAAFETQASAPQAMAKRRQEGALEGSNLSSQLPDQHFTHVQTIGTHVWACGFDGGLVHSTDGGINWTRLTPTDKHAKLQGDIISIVFADVNHGTLKTSTEETWTTSDAGQSWKKK